MKLSLRDLFWLVLVCALSVGWWVERQRGLAEQKKNRELTHQNDALWQTHRNLADAIGSVGYGVVVDTEGKATIWKDDP